MTKEPRLNELAGSSRLALGFFNSLIRRIECTKPIAGDNIVLSEKDDGVQISTNFDSLFSTAGGGGGGGGGIGGLEVITLNVCSGGVETTIQVLGRTSLT